MFSRQQRTLPRRTPDMSPRGDRAEPSFDPPSTSSATLIPSVWDTGDRADAVAAFSGPGAEPDGRGLAIPHMPAGRGRHALGSRRRAEPRSVMPQSTLHTEERIAVSSAIAEQAVSVQHILLRSALPAVALIGVLILLRLFWR